MILLPIPISRKKFQELIIMQSNDIVIIGILLTVGAILRYFLTMLHTPLTPNMVIAFYCLAIILISPRIYEALVIGIVAGVLSMVISSSIFPPGNLISEPIGALTCFGIYLIISSRTIVSPTLTTFLATLASGFTFAVIATIAVPDKILTKYPTMWDFIHVVASIVVVTAIFNALIVGILYPSAKRILQ